MVSQFDVKKNKKVYSNKHLAFSQEDDKHFILYTADISKGNKLKISALGRGVTKKDAFDEAYKRGNITKEVHEDGF